MNDFIYSTTEAAEYCGMSRSTFYRYLKEGMIEIYLRPSVGERKLRRCYRKSDLEKFRKPLPAEKALRKYGIIRPI
uniref:helix-turn-helix transcriptional regulator n=1 Tax=Alistipes sp. TaxID=1872444 RepID=UPI004055D461